MHTGKCVWTAVKVPAVSHNGCKHAAELTGMSGHATGGMTVHANACGAPQSCQVR